ncbi:1-acyl-sn-glycerol-3-phosphate acyltransferase [Candidatus Falkowbacteria bacterium]|nr:1-acyl-sn-glycerol-3-phosphate acyltransferase [Candidatus Falkowbacteria bacterium]
MNILCFFPFFHHITWVVSNIIGKLFLNLKVFGRENLKNLDSGGVIFVANHQGRFDPFLIGASIPFSYFSKIKCFRYQTYYKFIIERWYGLFIWLMGAYPVYPKSGPLEKVLAKTVKILKDNQSVLIFPEGKLNQYFDPAYNNIRLSKPFRNVIV